MNITIKTNSRPMPLKRHRTSLHNRRMYDPSKADKKAWIESVRDLWPDTPLTCPVKLKMKFTFKRPKCHFRTGKYSGEVKSSAPTLHCKKPDLDNLVKFYMDALTNIFYRDDSLVHELRARKLYGLHNQVEIVLETAGSQG